MNWIIKSCGSLLATFAAFYCFLATILDSQRVQKSIVTQRDLCFRNCQFYQDKTTEATSYKLPENFTESTCSGPATDRGKGQKIVSFSYYGDLNSARNYFEGIDNNAKLIRELYPGWLMRVYHDIRDVQDQRILCRLQCEYSDILDTCFAGDIPGYGNLLGSQENAWRFLALSDPLVDVVLSRDLDSFVSEREVAAVSEWLQSNMSLHIMRDHPVGHNTMILAGTWGARVSNDRDLWRNTSESMLDKWKHKLGIVGDTFALSHCVWPLARSRQNFVMQHDSYTCQRFTSVGLMRPFPTQRNVSARHNFIGSRNHIDGPLVHECPQSCRADASWTYC